MDVQAEKLYLIEQLTRLQDVRIIQQIKEIIDARLEPIVGCQPSGEPITKQELIARAKASNKAIAEDRVTSIEDLERED